MDKTQSGCFLKFIGGDGSYSSGYFVSTGILDIKLGFTSDGHVTDGPRGKPSDTEVQIRTPRSPRGS